MVSDVTGKQGFAWPSFSGRVWYLRISVALGTLENGLLHQELGRWSRRNQQLANKMDERRWKDRAFGLFRRRSFLRTEGRAARTSSLACQRSAQFRRALPCTCESVTKFQCSIPFSFDRHFARTRSPQRVSARKRSTSESNARNCSPRWSPVRGANRR